jgi:hypothetical protein
MRPLPLFKPVRGHQGFVYKINMVQMPIFGYEQLFDIKNN